MSFSSQVKQELNKTNNLSNKTTVKYELIGYLISGNTIIQDKKEIKFSTESDYNINRFSKLLANLDINHKINIIGKTFLITANIKDIDFVEYIKDQIYLPLNIQKDDNNLKAIIRGCFLGSGSITNPKKEYHLEIDYLNEKNQKQIIYILEEFDIKVKKMEAQNKYYIYIKEGEEISKFLALIGANKAVMEFEDIRIQKEMRGKVNRLVNCKTANLNKTINASIEQIGAIEKLQKTGKFKKLDDNLKEIAQLRIDNPEIPLIELGKKLKQPIGKSGVNYRMKKIIQIANEDLGTAP